MRNPAAIDAEPIADADYFRARARDELLRVNNAPTARARNIHLEMADHYEAVARLLETGPDREGFTLAQGLRRMLQRLNGD